MKVGNKGGEETEMGDGVGLGGGGWGVGVGGGGAGKGGGGGGGLVGGEERTLCVQER